MKTKLFITGLAFIAMTALTFAQNSVADKNQKNPSPSGKCLSYVDANKNGICDNLENRMLSVPAGNRNSNCRCFVQGKQNVLGKGRGMGPGKRMARRQGRSGNMVDANKNGVCDFYESAAKR